MSTKPSRSGSVRSPSGERVIEDYATVSGEMKFSLRDQNDVFVLWHDKLCSIHNIVLAFE